MILNYIYLLQTDSGVWDIFIGRFHPLVVHLPIGFLILGFILQFLARKSGKMKTSIRIALLLGSISAWLACYIGWLLSSQGYDDDLLAQHKWLGIATAFSASLLWVMKKGWVKISNKAFTIFFFVNLVLLSLTGHVGGSLTHGEDYLTQYLPFKSKIETGDHKLITLEGQPQDSIIVFTSMIRPVLENKCFSCHGESKQNGGLKLNTYEDILAGGDTGPVFIGGNALGSELFHRVTIDPANEKYMPTKGTPMSYSEIKLLEWWINNGAEFDEKLVDFETSEAIQNILISEFDIDTRPKPRVQKLKVPPVDKAKVEALIALGFNAKVLSEKSNLLDVNYSGKSKTLNPSALKLISELSPQITWLNLSNIQLSEDNIVALNNFEVLTRLRIDNTSITDASLKQLKALPNLESISLVGNEITDTSLEHLSSFPALKRIYLWNTKVSKEGVIKFKDKLEIDTGFSFNF